jgi:hypothetical protein
MEGGDIDEINRRKEKLTRISHTLAEKFYRQTHADTQHQGSSESKDRSKSNTDEEVVDAEFEKG